MAPSSAAGLDRRALLRATLTAGGALLLRFPLRLEAAFAAEPPSAVPFAPNGFLRIAPDGQVTLYAPLPDMGQGTRTSLPMVVAEELDLPWSAIKVLQADLDPAAFPEGQGAGGSDSLYSGWEPARRAAATARLLLVKAAAARWGVPASACSTESAAVVHTRSARRVAYVELLGDASRATVDAAEIVPKSLDRYRLVGTRIGGVDVPAIVTGRPLYGLDFRLPEATLRASIAHAPRHGAKLLQIDEAAALAVPGVRRVVAIDGLTNPTRLRRGIAVLADTTWAALQGRRALAPQWEPSAAPEDDSSGLSARFHSHAGQSGKLLRDGGDVEAALASATTTYDATFEAPFLAHACLEPMNCTAWLRDGRCDVWGPLQQPGGARRTVAEATGLAPEAIAIHPTRIGGGFGRRLLSDLAAEAAVLSRAAGRPVQVVWSREDDIAHDYYRPAVLHRVRAGLDANGRVIAWHHRFVGVSRNAYRLGTEPPESTETYGLFAPRPADAAAAQADSESDFVPCAVPHVRVEFTAVPTAIATGAWRAPAHCVNAFVIESALDELARLAGRDALAIRREVLGRRADFPHLAGEYDPDRAVEALGRAAEAIGWGRPRTKTSNQARRGIGLAGHFTFSSYAAVGVEVEVTPEGAVKVLRAVVAVDCGRVINRAGVEAQAEGGVIDGLGSALFGEITVRAGVTEQSNFDGYRLIRHGEAPPVEVHILEHDDPRPRGMGEIALPPAAPALANAIFDACGVRLRKLPLAPALAAALAPATRATH